MVWDTLFQAKFGTKTKEEMGTCRKRHVGTKLVELGVRWVGEDVFKRGLGNSISNILL